MPLNTLSSFLVVVFFLSTPAKTFQAGECCSRTLKPRFSTCLYEWWHSPYGSATVGVREMGNVAVGADFPLAPPPPPTVAADVGVAPSRAAETMSPARRDIRRGRFGGEYVVPSMAERDAMRRGGMDVYGPSLVEQDAMRRGGMDLRDPSPLGPTVQGGSLRTYQNPYAGVRDPDEKALIELRTDGRPLEGNFQVWDGPDNTPSNVNVFSQDGYHYGVRMLSGRRNGAYYGGSESYQVRNTGPLEFPMRARVDRTRYDYDSYGGSRSFSGGVGSMNSVIDLNGDRIGERQRYSVRNAYQPYSSHSTPSRPGSPYAQTIQGGSNKCFPVPLNCASVKVELHSEGMPIVARVELLQGPNNVKTLTEVYQQDGYERPFVAVLDTPGYNKGSIRIVNDGPMEFPIRATVEPYEVY